MSNNLILRSDIESKQCLFDSFSQLLWHELNQLDENKVCLIDASTDERLTVSELKTRANSIAVALIERGINKTDKIAFSGQNSIQHLVLRFAVHLLGNTTLLLHPWSGEYEMQQAIESTETEIIVISGKDYLKYNTVLNSDCKPLKFVIVFDGKHDNCLTFDQLLEEGRDQTLKTIPYFDVGVDDILLMVFSSGTTGASKCIMQSHRTFIMTFATPPWDGYRPSTVGLVLSLTLIASNMTIFELLYGTVFIIFPEYKPQLVLSSIAKYGIVVLKSAPIFMRKFFYDAPGDEYDLSSLRSICTVGEFFPHHISGAIRDKYGLHISEFYGMSEFMYITMGANEHDQFIPGSLGHVSRGTELKIANLITGQALGPNIDGEICIRGNTLFSGYYNNEKGTKGAFDSEGWFKTGDIGHYDHKQRVFITDRIHSFISVGNGCRISPVNIEQYLLSIESIAGVAVVGVNSSAGVQCPRAYVVVKNGHSISGNEIEEYVSDKLFAAKQLKGGVMFVDRIQRTGMGKVDRKYYKNLVKDEIIE